MEQRSIYGDSNKQNGLCLFLSGLYSLVRTNALVTKILGPRYKRSRKFFEICITFACNLRCLNCDMSCRQAASDEHMSVAQIENFIKESVANNHKWERIRITGGEPTLHPQLFEILQLLLQYKKIFSLNTRLSLVTNGFGEHIDSVLSRIPKEIEINNTAKKSEFQNFHPFNFAPQDSWFYKLADYSNGCWVMSECGMGLTSEGYYHCVVAGGIDRIFGFNVARKRLPAYEDAMEEQLRIFCRFCGHFRRGVHPVTRETMSPAWETAYRDYDKRRA